MGKMIYPGSWTITWAVLVIGLITLASCVVPPIGREPYLPQPKTRPQINISDLEKQVHALVNKERLKQGLSPLEWDSAISRIARKHSQDMVERKYFAHVSPEGHDFLYRYKQTGYACAVPVGRVIYTGAENILQTHMYDSVIRRNGETTYDWNSQEKIANDTVHIWMNSPKHRENILNPSWRREGIGIAVAPEGKLYITQNFC